MRIILLLMLIILASCTRDSAKTVGDWAGGVGREYKVGSSANQIYSYEWFYSQYAEIQALAGTVSDLKKNPKYETEWMGCQQVLRKMINDYNFAAEQVEGMARYKAKGLPVKLLLSDYHL